MSNDAQNNQNEQIEEKETYTKEEVAKIILDAQKRQMEADSMRIHGNAFFAEALDHIDQLGRKDPFWKLVHQYGLLFERQFKVNSGQVQTAAPQEPQPAQAAPKTRPDLKKKVEGSGEMPAE